MNTKNAHKRVLLSKNPCGRIDYCEGCDVVELEMGPMSIRLHAKDLTILNELVQQAEASLHYYQNEKRVFETSLLNVEGIH